MRIRPGLCPALRRWVRGQKQAAFRRSGGRPARLRPDQQPVDSGRALRGRSSLRGPAAARPAKKTAGRFPGGRPGAVRSGPFCAPQRFGRV